MPATAQAWRLTQGWRRLVIARRDAAHRAAVAAGLSPRGTALAVTAAQAAMVAAADRFIADYLTLEVRRPVPAVGLVASEYTTPEKTAQAVTTARQRHEGAALAASLLLIVQSDVTWAARTAQRDAMSRRPGVSGWRRMTGGDPCPKCRAWADGTVLPSAQDLAGHPGCSCVAVPVLSGRDDRYLPTAFPRE